MSSSLHRSKDSDSTTSDHDPSGPVANEPNDDWPKPSGFDLDGDGTADTKDDDGLTPAGSEAES